MSPVLAIGDPLAGYALVGVEVRAAVGAEAALEAWAGLPRDVGLLILTREAHDALAAVLDDRPDLLWAIDPLRT